LGPRNTVGPGEGEALALIRDRAASARWVRLWLSGESRGSMAGDVGLTDADCVAVQQKIGGWPIPGSRKAVDLLVRLERWEGDEPTEGSEVL